MTSETTGRNDPCPCGSGRKYKQCCLDKDEAAARTARAAAAAELAAATPEPAAAAENTSRSGREARTQQGAFRKGGAPNTRGFHKFSSPRKVGS